MLEEKKISKFLSDASLSKICNLLKSKAEYYGKRYIQIYAQNVEVTMIEISMLVLIYYLKELGNTCKNLYCKNRKQRRTKSTAATVGS